ncbi:hypothetical protein [Streptomyces celluloflavus]|uniref:hypothetical protein n=1 Tax=Streptomyces celluloflavus TaxID=58344 RepID=UPI0036BC97DA
MHTDAEDTEMRRILTDDEHRTAYHRAQDIALRYGHQLTYPETTELVAAVLAAADVLTPPPTPNPDTCTAQFADQAGDWWQCNHNPGHPNIYHHTEEGEYAWTDGTPGTVPAHPTIKP